MATLDDKILGEKLQYYCSSSEDEDEGEEKPEEGDDDNRERDRCKNVKRPQFVPDAKVNEYEAYKGTSVNTGPKGVIRDWQRYKQLQNEQSVENNAELQALAKKLSLTCRSDLDEQKEKDKQKHEEDDLQLHLEEMEDEFLQQYRLKRMQEMMSVVTNLPKFGKLVELTSGQAFLAAIEKEVPQVNVIIHIYDDLTHACEAMNGCLQCLAAEYQTTKFCKIRAGCIGPLSKHFISTSNHDKKKQQHENPYILTYRTEVIKNTLNPTWRPFTVPVRLLCNGDYDRSIKIECWDWNSSGS
ncbi:PREDICTED: phosducin-like protein [Priapulus caudatus]|uniref:Phosducin-like protein n=1 Tax=Priapulus caudatus TaxID=37621 RepID=A0ABM1ERM0_PRICU|nr:PREDICTED: phosducin-like protein [Priapulus caudatus]